MIASRYLCDINDAGNQSLCYSYFSNISPYQTIKSLGKAQAVTGFKSNGQGRHCFEPVTGGRRSMGVSSDIKNMKHKFFGTRWSWTSIFCSYGRRIVFILFFPKCENRRRYAIQSALFVPFVYQYKQ